MYKNEYLNNSWNSRTSDFRPNEKKKSIIVVKTSSNNNSKFSRSNSKADDSVLIIINPDVNNDKDMDNKKYAIKIP